MDKTSAFSIDNLITVALIGVITSLLSKFQNSIIQWIEKLLCVILSFRFSFRKMSKIIITKTANTTSTGITSYDNDEYANGQIISAIIEKTSGKMSSRCISKLMLIQNNTEIKIDNNDQLSRKLAVDFVEFPFQKWEADDITFNFNETITPGEGGSTRKVTELTLSSYKLDNSQLKEYSRKCYEEYITKLYGVKPIYVQFYIFPRKNGNEPLAYTKYALNLTKVFSGIYFPEKNALIKHIDDLQNGKINKVSLLLHGLPGCGKSSLIKAIAKHTKRHIINVKLSQIQSDQDLFSIFAIDEIPISDVRGRIMEWMHIDPKKKMFVLEDVDAETEILEARDNEPKKEEKDEAVLLKLLKYNKNNKLTLSGILNVFDGIYELNDVIIVMTTNHKTKLDPAFTRPGRITFEIELQKMTTENAREMMYDRFGKHIDIINQSMSPAELEAFCNRSDNIDELREIIREEECKFNKTIIS